jgi:hypothetical protein
MIIKECFVTYNGISCIYSQANIINYIGKYFLLRLLEIVLIDTISKKDEFKLIDCYSPYIDF